MGFFKRESQVISYTIDKGFTSNLAISVQNGQVAVSAPWYFSKKQIDNIILDKKTWILQKIKEYNETNQIKKANLEEKTVKVFGEDYFLNITYKLINNPELNFSDKVIKIVLPVKYRNIDNTRIINLVLNKFYDKLAEKEIEKTMEKTRINLGIAPDDYKIQKISFGLGKFVEESKNIIINPEIVKYNRDILEYVILHEFCHLKYKTHAKSFYKIIEKYIPNYKEIEEQINNTNTEIIGIQNKMSSTLNQINKLNVQIKECEDELENEKDNLENLNNELLEKKEE